MRMAEERNFFLSDRKCPKDVLQFDRYLEDVTSGHPSGGHGKPVNSITEPFVRRYLPSEPAVAIHAASRSETADMLQTSRALRASPHADPVRTVLLIAAAFATLLVAGVAVKTLLPNTLSVLSTQSSR